MNTTQVAPQDTSSSEHSCTSISTEVRCFVYPVSAKRYLAECIDLDIAAEGATEKEARRGLRDAMLGYLSVVCDGQLLQDANEEAFRKLILRPAPFTHRIHYYIGKMKQTAFPKGQTRNGDRFYTLPAPCGH